MNYTVLVVEDEENQRRALIDRVQWEKAGFTVVGEAENGAEALDKVELLEPDLILTDIRMPLITGLELAARVREMRPATQIVILSGYDSFEYARTAINYNIISYLLKPISSAELSEELFDIHRRMEERIAGIGKNTEPDSAADTQARLKKLTQTEFLQPILFGGAEEQAEDDAEYLEKATELGIITKDVPCKFCVLVSKFKKEQVNVITPEHADFVDKVIGRYADAVSFIAYGRVVTLTVFDAGAEPEKELELALLELVQTAKRMMDETCTVGVSREFSKLSECSAAYFEAVTARRYTSDGAGEVRFIADKEKTSKVAFEYVEKSVLKVEQLLKVGSFESLCDFIGELYETNTPENANLLVVQIIATVCRVVNNTSDNEEMASLVASNPIFARITAYNSESGMKSELIEFCRAAKNIIEQSQKRDSEILCDKALQIIEERFGDESLSLTGVSAELAVSPNYLSALIKREKKQNFITLLTEKRMKTAHDLLVCSTMKILEISEKCGYSDQHYFSYCFKKFYGVSPNKVRGAGKSDEA